MPMAPSRGIARTPLSLVRCLPLIALLLAPLAAGAITKVDTIAVKYRDGAPTGAVLPADDLRKLGHLHKSTFLPLGPTRDGAMRIALDPPLDIDDARAAMNRLRLDPAVLYVAIVDRVPESKRTVAAKSASAQRPVSRLIVKFKDPGITAAALADRPLAAPHLQRVADIVGMPVATLRSMTGGAYVLQFFSPVAPDTAYAMAEALEQEPSIQYADPDMWKQPTLVPNDSCYPANTNPTCFDALVESSYLSQWHLMPGGVEVGGANLPPAWDLTIGASNLYVGVIDTGYLYDHPDLAGRAIGGYDFIWEFAGANDSQPPQSAECLQGNDPRLYAPFDPPCVSSRDNDPSDPGDWIDGADYNGTPSSWFYGCDATASTWHGSHVGGTIGASSNNAMGVAGINWVSKIVPLRVLGKCGGWTSDIVDAIAWGSGGSVAGIPANAYPARVLNLSLGGGGPCGSSEQEAIDGALGRGTVVVISAGNTNTDAGSNSPGNCLGNITVAATQRQGIKAQYSAYGATVEISAPGGGRNYPETPSIVRNLVVSTINNGPTVPNPTGYYYEGYNGTSMAAPHVAGVASLMLSRNDTLTPAQVLAVLQTTARPFPVVAGAACPSGMSCTCTTSLCGAGLLDAGAAVAAVPLQPKGRRAIDFNADSKGDLVWRNASSGSVALWLMNGLATLDAAQYLGDPTYSVTHTGDLDGGRKTDLIWRNSVGSTAAWLMNGTMPVASSVLFADPYWAVQLVADFNGDGKEDLLWRNAVNGQVAIWLMDGLTSPSAAVIFSDPNWTVTHVGDFNGDRKADLVWRNSTTGDTAIWLMDGTAPASSAIIFKDPAWTVSNTGDFNGDGKMDLVWKSTAGSAAVWLMDGVTVLGAAYLPLWTTHMEILTGDLDGDGKSDLITYAAWVGTVAQLMNGVVMTSQQRISGDPNWKVTHVADTNGDGKVDLLWRRLPTGVTALWMMNGLLSTSQAILTDDANWSLSPPDGY